MKRLLQEPLLHFLILGAMLFGGYGLLRRGEASSPAEIVVTAGRIQSLSDTFAKSMQRAPTPAELRRLVDQFVEEEVLSREALRLGLDQDDTVIRQRLAQKMEFLAEDFDAAAEPDDEELARYLAAHAEEFAHEARFTFLQVFLDPDKHGNRLGADATALLDQLKQTGPTNDLSRLGDRLPLPRQFTLEPRRAVVAEFGEDFANQLARVKTNEWSGPVTSRHGTHLVFVTRRTEYRLPALDEVRSRVKKRLLRDRREEARRRYLDGLLAKYHVTLQWPKEDTRSAAPAVPQRP